MTDADPLDVSPADRRTLLRLASAELTYPEVAATAREQLPAGYTHVRREAVVGRGVTDFDQAASALVRWQVQQRAGLRVAATDSPLGLGTVVLQRIGVGPLRLTAACRVVDVVDEPRRRGFAYGTLPGHPESGEERFVLELGRDDVVRLHLTVFTRPATLLSRLGWPVARLAIHVMETRYLRALARPSR